MPLIPSEDEWLEQTAKAQQEVDETQGEDPLLDDAPVHPIPQLQGPFEESIAESTVGPHSNWQVFIDAHARRNQILTASVYERLCGRRWRQRPNEKYHPLWKLISQIAFGLHLLAKGLAKSEPAVINILQVHVAELDGFIENTSEDIVIAFSDIEERLTHLRLPLGNIPVFSEMLADEPFRQTVIRDHDRIQHIIQRTALAMDDNAKDIEKGLQSVRILGMYLLELRDDWDDQTGSLDAVYSAMAGNVDGWEREFKRLKRKAWKLAKSLSMLHQVATEIKRLVDVYSVDNLVTTRPISRGDRHQKKMQTKPKRLTTIMHSPIPELPADSDSHTAKAKTGSTKAGDTPATLVGKSSRKESPASTKPGSFLRRGYQPKSSANEKESSSQTQRYYAHSHTGNMTPRRSATAPAVSESQNKDNRKERRAEQQRPKTSYSKAVEHSVVPQKESNRTLARFGSRIDRFQKSTAKLFGVSAFSRSSTKKKTSDEPKTSAVQKPPLRPTERSWIDLEAHDKEMSWSRQAGGQFDLQNPGRKDTGPEFPHLFSMSFLEDQPGSDEEDLKSPDEEKIGDEADKENEITALPTVMNSMAGRHNESDQDDDMAAEVASTYSAKNRRFRAKNLNVPPLPKPKFGRNQNSNSNNHVIYQNRNWLRPKPSSVFSFISSKRGTDDASMNSPSLFRSRRGSGISETPSRSTSAQTNHIHGSVAPAQSPEPIWAAPKDVLSANMETPPISPNASFSAAGSAYLRPGTSQSSARGSVCDQAFPVYGYPRKASSTNTQERRGSNSTTGRTHSDIRSPSPLSITTTLDKPQHGGLSLFPRTPTTPRVHRLVSKTSLREVTALDDIDDRSPGRN